MVLYRANLALGAITHVSLVVTVQWLLSLLRYYVSKPSDALTSSQIEGCSSDNDDDDGHGKACDTSCNYDLAEESTPKRPKKG